MELRKPLLLAAKGGGSAIVEAQFAHYGLDVDLEYIDWDHLRDDAGRLKQVNPLMEVPTLVLPSGQVISESAAITLYLADVYPLRSLLPAPEEAHRAECLRWLMWLVCAVYPTFTYGDHPERFVDKAVAGQLKLSTDKRREVLWQQFETQIDPGPYALGKDLGALDLYLAVMCCWRPGPAWFAEHCPKIFSVAARVAALAQFQPVWQRNRLTW